MPISNVLFLDDIVLIKCREYLTKQVNARRAGAVVLRKEQLLAQSRRRRVRTEKKLTCKIETVSTPSMPPMRLIKSPHRSTHFLISARCGTAPSMRGIRSTMSATTASRTRRRGTLLAIRSVLSSTLAFSRECPSEKARSSDSRTSVWNSWSSADTAVVVAFGTEGADVMDEVTEAFCEADS